MNILILGAGRVGESVAENLVSEQNDITVIDTDPRRLRLLQDRLDLRGVTGNGIHPTVLKAAGIEDADMLIACAALDETNLVVCKMARERFNVTTTIARLRSAEFQDDQAARPARFVRRRRGDLPRGIGDALHPQAGRVPRGAAGARVRDGSGQPDRGARDQRRADGRPHHLGAAAARARQRDALRRDLPHRRARQRPPDPVRRRDPHRARRRGLRAGGDERHPRACSTRCAGATSRCGA